MLICTPTTFTNAHLPNQQLVPVIWTARSALVRSLWGKYSTPRRPGTLGRKDIPQTAGRTRDRVLAAFSPWGHLAWRTVVRGVLSDHARCRTRSRSPPVPSKVVKQDKSCVWCDMYICPGGIRECPIYTSANNQGHDHVLANR